MFRSQLPQRGPGGPEALRSMVEYARRLFAQPDLQTPHSFVKNTMSYIFFMYMFLVRGHWMRDMNIYEDNIRVSAFSVR